MTALPLNNIINVNLAQAPNGLPNINMNSICLFTKETPSNIDPYRIYTNPLQVATDYGTSSNTYALASTVFSQSINIMSGNGQLVIAPLQSSVSATSGNWVSTNISTNLSAIIAVTKGDIRISIDGTNLDIIGANFTSCQTLSDVATILQRSAQNVIITASSTALTFTSKTVGTTSAVIVEAVPANPNTNLAASGFFNTAAGTETNGIASSGETLVAALNRVGPQVQFVGWFTNLQVEDTVAVSTATANQALPYIWVHSWASQAEIAGVCTTIIAAGNDQTIRSLYSTNLTDATTFRAAVISRAFSVDFNGSNTFSSIFLKTITGLAADPGITQSVYSAAQTAGVITYDNFGIPGLSNPAYTGTRYFDQVYGDIWTTFALQIAGFNTLAATTTLVSQTEAGMNQLLSSCISVMKQGVTVGYIGTGLNWSGSIPFGDPVQFANSINAVGYYIYSQPIAQQSQTTRTQRIAPTIQIAFKRAGGIQMANIYGIVQS